ncbi:MAG: hypothetical protein FJ087_18035 [Deltaproteobacteria bacterium]|nr:hypothetical protein [Deltaproteobacteria bacterium]
MDAREAAILRAVADAGGTVTEARLLGATGLTRHELAPALRSVVRRTACVLRVTDQGDILYVFGPRVHDRLDARDRAREGARRALGAARAVGVRAFQFWLLAMLVGYGAFYGLVLWALLDRVGVRGQLPMREVARLLGGLARGALSRRRRDAPSGRTAGYHDRLMAFLFGAGPGPLARRARDRAFLDHALANRGLVAASDWSLLFGDPLDAADTEAARIHADFGADVRVTGNGSLLYDFGALVPERPPAPPPTLAAREEEARTLASSGRVAAITLGLNALNAAGAAGFAWFLATDPEWGASAASWALLAVAPGAFSACVFALAAARALRGRVRRALAAAIARDERVVREQADLAEARTAAPAIRAAGRVVWSTDDQDP